MLVATDDGVDDGLLGELQFHLVRHLAGPASKVRPFLLGGAGVAHWNAAGSSDGALLFAAGVGVDYRWTPLAGFRLDLRLVEFKDLLGGGWTENLELLWGPTFAF